MRAPLSSPAKDVSGDRGPWRHSIDVVAVLISRDFKGRYRNTGIGVVWSVLNPLMFLVAFYVVFALLLKIGIENYASFAFIGILAWNWMQSALAQSAESITSSATLAAQPGFPLHALPLAAVGTNFVHLLIALPLLALLLLLEGVRIAPIAILLVPILLIEGLLLVGLCQFAAALNVRYRDTQHILPVLLQVGYFLTPIFYSLAMLGESAREWFILNPMAVLITSYRSVLLHQQAPDWVALGTLGVISVVLILASRAYFERQRDLFLERL